MKLVIVVPCYNEEEVLAETTRQLSSVVDELLSDGKIDEGKILYVDDGSRDRTWELIRGFSETHPSVTGLKLAHNVGHQQALWAGLEWAASHADCPGIGHIAVPETNRHSISCHIQSGITLLEV